MQTGFVVVPLPLEPNGTVHFITRLAAYFAPNVEPHSPSKIARMREERNSRWTYIVKRDRSTISLV